MELREKLEEELVTLEEELSAHGRVQTEDGDWEGSSVNEDGEESDPNDASDQIEELVTNVPLVEELEAKHEDVEEALERMDHGIYGLCEAGGEPIPVERLVAMPSARTCVQHAE